MNEGESQRAELDRLVAALCDAEITPEEIARLEQLALADPALRTRYFQHLSLHALAERRGQRTPQEIAFKGSPLRVSFSRVPFTFSRLLGHARWSFHEATAAILLVAALFYGSFTLLAWNLRSSGNTHSTIPTQVAATADVVSGPNNPLAQLTRVDDAQWKEEPATADNEHVNRILQVHTGFAEFEFTQGAKVVVEGPAEFKVCSENSGFLRKGRLVATVPVRAIGFTIETPTAKVVDLGTEFAAEVRNGGTDVRVFRGAVELHQSGSNRTQASPQSGPLTLRAGEAARVATSAKSGLLVTERSEGEKNSETTGRPPDDGLVLWLRADAIDRADQRQVRKTAGGLHVARWENQARSLSDAYVAQPNPERQPMLWSRGLNGMPAVRFDRGRIDSLFLDEQPIVPLGSPRTVFVVGRASSHGDGTTGGTLVTFQRPRSWDTRVHDLQQLAVDPKYLTVDSANRTGILNKVSLAVERPFLGVFLSPGRGKPVELHLNGEPSGIIGSEPRQVSVTPLTGGQARKGFTASGGELAYAYHLGGTPKSPNGDASSSDTKTYTIQGVSFLPETANTGDFTLSGTTHYPFTQPDLGDHAADNDLEEMLRIFAYQSDDAKLTLNNLVPGASYQVDLLISSTPDNRVAHFTFNGQHTNSFTEFANTIYDVRQTATANESGQIVVALTGTGNPVLAGAFVVSRALQPAAAVAALPGITIGAYGLDVNDQAGAWDGDIAEVLIYDRAMADDQIQVVNKYLTQKYKLSR